MSIGGASTLPPSFCAFARDSSRLATKKEIIHWAGTGETLLTAGAAYAATGRLSVWWVVALACRCRRTVMMIARTPSLKASSRDLLLARASPG
jgi:hypothetical protein